MTQLEIFRRLMKKDQFTHQDEVFPFLLPSLSKAGSWCGPQQAGPLIIKAPHIHLSKQRNQGSLASSHTTLLLLNILPLTGYMVLSLPMPMISLSLESEGFFSGSQWSQSPMTKQLYTQLALTSAQLLKLVGFVHFFFIL